MARQPRITKSRRKKKAQPRPQAANSGAVISRRLRITIKKEDETRISFSDLPPELRNVIYEHALRPTGDHAIPFTLYPKVAKLDIVAFNLLNTCYAIRREANAIFYGRNTFRVDLLNVPGNAREFENLRSRYLSQNAEDREAKREALRNVNNLREQLERPLLPEALKAITAKNVALVKSFEFAFHVGKPKSGGFLSTVDLSRTPKFVVKLQFQKKGFDLVLHQPVEDDELRRSWNRVLAPLFASMIETRGLRLLAKNDILTLASTILGRPPGQV